VRLGLVVDLRLLPVVAQNRIRRYGKALVAILKTLDPSLEEKGKLPAIQKGGFVTRDDLDIAIDEINRNVRNGYLHQHRHPFNTVQFLTIQGLHYADRPT
jgi:hypothetical protein